jgi:biotin operon repressor
MKDQPLKQLNNLIYGEVRPDQDERDILEPNTLIIENEALRKGFTITPNYILRDQTVSFGAKLTYTLLLSYAWQEGNCFPGQTRLGHDLGVTRKAVNKYLRELKEKGFVTWTRRGMGKTNVYYILDYKPENEADVTMWLHQDVTARSHQDVTQRLHKEDTGEKDSEEEYSDTSKLRKARSSEKNSENRSTDRGVLGQTIFPPKTDKPAQKAGFSSNIAHVLESLSKHDLHDPTHITSNISRAKNLWRKSNVSEQAFLSLVAEAKKITFQHYGTIRKEAGYLGLKNQAPYFFRVLENLVNHKTLDGFRKRMIEQKSFG